MPPGRDESLCAEARQSSTFDGEEDGYVLHQQRLLSDQLHRQHSQIDHLLMIGANEPLSLIALSPTPPRHVIGSTFHAYSVGTLC